MDYDTFLGEVQHRLELPGTGEAARATRVVLSTLGERLGGGEAADLAAPLPMEIDRHLTAAESGQQFDYQTFVDRIAERANVGEGDAHYHAQAVFALVADCATGSEIKQVRAQLPADYEPLFAFVGQEETEATPW